MDNYPHPCLTDEKTEAQKGNETCPKPHTESVVEAVPTQYTHAVHTWLIVSTYTT